MVLCTLVLLINVYHLTGRAAVIIVLCSIARGRQLLRVLPMLSIAAATFTASAVLGPLFAIRVLLVSIQTPLNRLGEATDATARFIFMIAAAIGCVLSMVGCGIYAAVKHPERHSDWSFFMFFGALMFFWIVLLIVAYVMRPQATLQQSIGTRSAAAVSTGMFLCLTRCCRSCCPLSGLLRVLLCPLATIRFWLGLACFPAPGVLHSL